MFGHLPKSDTEADVGTILDAMTDAMVREQRNGEPVEIPQKRLIHFEPGKFLPDIQVKE